MAFVLALGLIAYDTCDKHERTKTTVVLDFGTVQPEVRAVEAEVWMNGEQVARFRREAMPGALIGPSRFEASVPDTKGELRVDVDLASGARKQVVRQVTFQEDATLTVRLERDLQ